MKKNSLLFFTFLCCFHFCFSEETTQPILLSSLKEARAGDYVVTNQNRMFTLLHLLQVEKEFIILEEVTIPERTFSRHCQPWKSWMSKGAQGHSSWLLYEVRLDTGRLVHCFSVTKNRWIDVSQGNEFLSTLLGMKWSFVPESKRRRMGPPQPGVTDHRPLWAPRLRVNDQPRSSIAFDVWSSRWPMDGSDLSGLEIEVYLPQKGQGIPTAFPSWLEVKGALAQAKIRVHSCGTEMKSTQKWTRMNHDF